MTFAPVMWMVWAALVTVMAALYVYRTNLTKNEEDQIFLDDSFDHERMAQAVIVSKVNRVQPLMRTMQWLVAGMSAVVLVYYVRDILVQLNVIG